MADPRNEWRYWRVHFTADPYYHWVNIDCGRRVTEDHAVAMAERAYPDRGSVTSCVLDVERERRPAVA